ncbi:hypothetical protein GQ457_15G001800 [Hibiscus cannabinus]
MDVANSVKALSNGREEVGSEVKNLVPGDRVALELGISCWRSDLRKEGRYNLCPEMKVPADPCFKLPDNVSLEEGAMCEPLSVVVVEQISVRIRCVDSSLLFPLVLMKRNKEHANQLSDYLDKSYETMGPRKPISVDKICIHYPLPRISILVQSDTVVASESDIFLPLFLI